MLSISRLWLAAAIVLVCVVVGVVDATQVVVSPIGRVAECGSPNVHVAECGALQHAPIYSTGATVVLEVTFDGFTLGEDGWLRVVVGTQSLCVEHLDGSRITLSGLTSTSGVHHLLLELVPGSQPASETWCSPHAPALAETQVVVPLVVANVATAKQLQAVEAASSVAGGVVDKGQLPARPWTIRPVVAWVWFRGQQHRVVWDPSRHQPFNATASMGAAASEVRHAVAAFQRQLRAVLAAADPRAVIVSPHDGTVFASTLNDTAVQVDFRGTSKVRGYAVGCRCWWHRWRLRLRLRLPKCNYVRPESHMLARKHVASQVPTSSLRSFQCSSRAWSPFIVLVRTSPQVVCGSFV